ncbi:class I SAM-dependent methyltransferase [Halotia wernerae UHCC 0503]|nr:class I SAM-dependent methyltransferase [Halotia wernerae UHCC 0503]
MSQFKSQLAGVPRTMLLTLRGRADEQKQPNFLFQDERAVKWSQSLPWDDQLEALYNPFSQVAWALRAYQFDQVAIRHIASHHNPLIVELGAGLSTRYYRVKHEKLNWIELDLPEVTNFRHQLDSETDQHRFISSSVIDFGWMDALASKPPTSILFIAEGLLMYFEAQQVQQIVNQMRQRFPGATLVMDVVGKISKATGSKYAQLGAPFLWFPKDEREVAALGLSLVNVWPLFQLYPERWPLLLRWFSWVPFIRNSCLILETKIQPI